MADIRDTDPTLQPDQGSFHPQAKFPAGVHDHEHSDVNVRGIFMFVIVLVAAALVVHVVLWFMFGFMEDRANRNDPQSHPLAPETQSLPPQKRVERFPEPRLQRSDVRDMNEFQQMQDLRLHNYTWVDQAAGRVTIPIDRAIDIVAERGLPAAERAPAVMPTDKNNQTRPTDIPQRRQGTSEGPKTGDRP